MFYSHTFLARKSPLGTVWIAAHLERKIKKPQIDGIDVPSYAECIMFPEVPIALRLSAHLLLGLVRIYSWKVNYLFQDCNRVLTSIRTAFASVQIDLPVDADRAPFESITLPETFDLEALKLDDTMHQLDTLDNHQKTHHQITLTDDFHVGDQYVAFVLDEYTRVDPSPPRQSSNAGPEPIEEEMLPPFEGGLEAIANPNNEGPIDAPVHNLANDSSNINKNNFAQDPPEIMREAHQKDFEPHLPELSDANNDPMDTDLDSSPFINSKGITSPVMGQSLSPGRVSLPGMSFPNAAAASAYDPFEHEAPIVSDHPLPELVLKPSPPPVQENRRKRKRLKFDKAIVLSNDYMKKQIDGDKQHDLVCKRRKLPQTALDLWKFNRTLQKDNFFHEPLLFGTCKNLDEILRRDCPILNDSASVGPSQGVADQSSVEDGHAEPSLPPKSPCNADAPLDGTVVYEDMAPELPCCAPDVELNLPDSMPSPSGREELTPFKTAEKSQQSDYGRTFETEILPTVRTTVSNLSSGMKDWNSGPQTSTFQLEEDFDRDLPEIPELLDSAGGELDFLEANSSSPVTKPTDLGSMSARTRAVAQYFKDRAPSTQRSDDEPGKFSLNKILEGKTRRHCSRMFFETLVLKTCDYIDVQQEEAYGDISVSVKPLLSTAKLSRTP